MRPADILTGEQQEALKSFAVAGDIAKTFVLSGGTALAAFYLFHRRSDDLDFFTQEPVDALRVRRFVEGLRGASMIVTSFSFPAGRGHSSRWSSPSIPMHRCRSRRSTAVCGSRVCATLLRTS